MHSLSILIWMCRTYANNAINPDVQERRFALLSHAGYGKR